MKLVMYLNREHVLEQWFLTSKDAYLALNIFGEKRDYVVIFWLMIFLRHFVCRFLFQLFMHYLVM